jgi:hypothetical protein
VPDLIPWLTAPQLSVLTSGLVGVTSSSVALYLLSDKVRSDRRAAATGFSWSNTADYSVNAPPGGRRPSQLTLRNTAKTSVYDVRLRVWHRGVEQPDGLACGVVHRDAGVSGAEGQPAGRGWALEVLLALQVAPETQFDVDFTATDPLHRVLVGIGSDTGVGVAFQDADGRSWMRMANGRLADLRSGRDTHFQLAAGNSAPPSRRHVLRRRALRRAAAREY